jgi:hypothetical protein
MQSKFPPSLLVASSINSSILSIFEISNFKISILLNFDFKSFSFSILVPDASIFAPISLSLLIIEFPMPPEAPVTIIFLPFKSFIF